MPSSNDHSRLSGDAVSRILAFMSIVLLASALFVLFARETGQSAAEIKSAAITAKTVNVNLTLKGQPAAGAVAKANGVDLLTFVGLNGDNNRLYVLSTYDRHLYKQIFAAQSKNEWGQANALMKRLHDPILVGHILYDRYINSADYKASYDELRDWMVNYNDHPEALKVYQLAQKRRANDPQALPAPQIGKQLLGSLEWNWLSKKISSASKPGKPVIKRNESQVRDLMQQIKSHLGNDRVTSAYNLLGSSSVSKTLTAVEYDSLLAEIASGYYYNGKFKTALKTANQAVKRSQKSVPVAHWIAGLSAWQLEEFSEAATHFQAVAQSHSRNPWMLSAGAFWAARAHDKMGKTRLSNEWLQEAAGYPRTFYGLIAKSRLNKNKNDGSQHNFSWQAPELTPTLISALHESPSGKRAMALLDIGQNQLAQQELAQTHPNGDPRLEKALIAVAHHFNLPALAWRLGNAINQPDGKLYDVALYPIIPWKGDPNAGVDPALINAMIRQESRFDSRASNRRSGAAGLMQLMPSTAQFVSDKSFDAKDLHNPEVNVALGQRYVRYLLDMSQVNGNLIYLAAAYNAGPGTLSRWKKSIPHNDDPFLFIESLPWSETRGFVARVMTNYWIYSKRLERDNDTLQDLGQGQWPVYELPADPLKMASNF